MSALNPQLMTTEDLLRYSRPMTPTEQALYAALKEAVEIREEQEEAIDTLTEERDDLASDMPEHKALVKFFDDITYAFGDTCGRWPGASPSDESYVAAVCDQIRNVAQEV